MPRALPQSWLVTSPNSELFVIDGTMKQVKEMLATEFKGNEPEGKIRVQKLGPSRYLSPVTTIHFEEDESTE